MVGSLSKMLDGKEFVLLLLIVAALWYWAISGGDAKSSRFERKDFKASDSLSFNVTNISADMWEKVFAKLFRPLGYQLNSDLKDSYQSEHNLLPLFPPLATCSKVFDDWLRVNQPQKSSTTPARWSLLSPGEQWAFRMRGYAEVRHWLIGGEAHNEDQRSVLRFTKEQQRRLAMQLRREKLERYGSYGQASVSMAAAMRAHLEPGGRGLTIGSQSPWLEVLALSLNASRVTAAEYQPINSTIEDVDWEHPALLARHWGDYARLDFVASFSSLEHAGLGRYGDAIDPIGDLRESRKVRCLLRKGGLFFLGLPSGRCDGVVFNAHRVYSHIRLSLMAAGFKIRAFYAQGDAKAVDFKSFIARLHSDFPSYRDVTAVLEKL